MGVRPKLRRFINHSVTEIVIGILIIAGIGCTIMEVKFAEPGELSVYGMIAQVITMIFIVELTIRYLAETSKPRFFKTFWIDMIAVIPFSNLFRILRIVRLLRLIRLGIVLTRRTRKMAQVINRSFAENMLIVVTLVVIFLIGAIGMYILKEKNIHGLGDAVWFSLFTLMGGEPIMANEVLSTNEGKVITLIVMLGGFTMFAIFTGVVSAIMVERLRGGMGVKDVELEELVGHYLICGWNRSALTIIREIQANRETHAIPIVIVAELEEEPYLEGAGINAARVIFEAGDYSSTEVLHRVRVQHAGRAIILADKSKTRSDQDRDARSILTALTIEKIRSATEVGDEEMDNGIYTCVELLNRDEQKVKVLQMAGVEDMVEADEYMGNLVAHSIRARGLVQVLEELFTSTWGNEFVRRVIPESLVGKSYADALAWYKMEEDELLISLVTRSNGVEACVVNPPADHQLKDGDSALLITAPDNGDRIASCCKSSDAQPTVPPETAAYRDHVILAGWNRAAPKILRELRSNFQTRDMEVVVISELREIPQNHYEDDPKVHFQFGDFTSSNDLEAACVYTASTAIILADKSLPRSDQDRDARTVLGALTIEKMSPHMHTCVELLSRDREKVDLLKSACVEDVVTGDEYIGNLIAHAARTRGLITVMDELLTSNIGNEFRKIPLAESWVGMRFEDLLTVCKAERDELVVALERDGTTDGEDDTQGLRHYVSNPHRECIMRKGDNLFVVCKG